MIPTDYYNNKQQYEIQRPIVSIDIGIRNLNPYLLCTVKCTYLIVLYLIINLAKSHPLWDPVGT